MGTLFSRRRISQRQLMLVGGPVQMGTLFSRLLISQRQLMLVRVSRHQNHHLNDQGVEVVLAKVIVSVPLLVRHRTLDAISKGGTAKLSNGGCLATESAAVTLQRWRAEVAFCEMVISFCKLRTLNSSPNFLPDALGTLL